MGVRFGLDRETALRSVTINGAKMLDLQDRVGSLNSRQKMPILLY